MIEGFLSAGEEERLKAEDEAQNGGKVKLAVRKTIQVPRWTAPRRNNGSDHVLCVDDYRRGGADHRIG